jgi:leucyl-tRNA synthetase
MPVPYDHREVEARWQQRWLSEPARRRGPKLYNLVEFPYPSAAGLHVGHAMTYSGADTWGRLQRMRGRDVFQPIGFDSFGINAENYALRVGEHPAAVVARTTETYRAQLRSIGAAWDWQAEVSTSDPSYYRWTQWVFLRLFEAGLAVRREAPVTWCPSCATVLANEQVEDGACERCGTEVGERVLRQWFLRTTAYADRLRRGLDDLDWPEPAKNRQRRWIDGLHDWLISRQRFWGPPIPVVHCPVEGVVPVPDDQLPVLLPEVEDPAAIRPTGTGLSPLASVPGWADVDCPSCGRPARRETDVSDTFFDSSWYFLRYPSAGVPDRPWDPEATAAWLPVDQYAGGPEHVARHHLYARFVCMALHDLGLLPFAEPFPRIRLHGMLTLGGAKMSKSRGNVVNPDHLVEDHGGDVTRLALLSARPWDADGDFGDEAVAGAERLLGRLWRLVVDRPPGPPADPAALAAAADRVAGAVDRFACNVAVTAIGELAGVLEAGSSADDRRTLVLLVAPLAPHLAEELWCRLGGRYSVHVEDWPAPVAAPAPPPAEVDVAVQVDGRFRATVTVPAGASADEAAERAAADPRVARHLAGRPVARVVAVPDRLVNLVTGGG